MKSSIATVCISGSLREKLTAISRAGFDGYELFENDFVTSSLSSEDVRERSADLGLTLDLYQPFRDIEGTTAERFAAALERARHKFQLMNRLGVDTILVCSNVGTATIDDDALAAEQLKVLAGVAADHGVRIAYEALAWGLPCLVSPMGGGEIIRDGVEGFVMDPYDVDLWAERIRQLAQDHALRETMARAARERAATFTWDRVGIHRRELLLSRVINS